MGAAAKMSDRLNAERNALYEKAAKEAEKAAV